MEDDSFLTNTDEYRLLEVYYQKRRKSRFRQQMHVCMCALESPTGDRFHSVADKLSQIADSELNVADGLESDGEDDVDVDVVDRLVELLKESGDELNEKIKRNHVLLGYLQSSFTYSVFENLTTTFIRNVVPEHQHSRRNREQIALTFEVTSRLKALDLHPMNRVMGFGAKYLQEHFTPWVQQHGGWEKAFDDGDDEELH